MSYLVKKGVWVFTASLISFGLTLTFLTFQLSHLGNDATSQLEKVISSYISGGKNEPHFMKYENVIIERNEMYKSIYIAKSKNNKLNSGWANVIEARNTYEGYTSLLNYISFQNVTSSFYSIQFLLFSLASLFLIYSYMTDLDKYASSLNALFIAILGSFSWIIIMPLHFYLHSIYWRGISDIVLMFPFYTIVIMLYGLRYRGLFFSDKKASNISTV
jgi:hypothetical protein